MAAANFFQTTQFMDVSYNGIFFRRNVAAVAALVKFSRPDYLSFDIETMPPFDEWVKVAATSSNFQARVNAGESRSAGERHTTHLWCLKQWVSPGRIIYRACCVACLRLAQGWIGSVVNAARAEMPSIKPAMYTAHAIFDLGFQLTSWPMLAKLNFSTEPSYHLR